MKKNDGSIENRPHPAHPLLSPTRTLLSALMSVLPCKLNNCPSFLFMPISSKPQKILLCPVSPLFLFPHTFSLPLFSYSMHHSHFRLLALDLSLSLSLTVCVSVFLVFFNYRISILSFIYLVDRANYLFS